MPRFVLVRHECPPGYVKPSHWDFMLEADGVLLTWELRELPTAWGGTSAAAIDATRLPDHRLAYLDYEGPLSGNRGTVRRVEGGTVEFIEQNAERIRATLDSPTIRGALELTLTSDDWQLSFSDHDDA
jgi:hypothetical protein